MDQNGIDSNLLSRYVAGEANALQRAQVEAWVRLDEANAQELDRWQRIWSYSVAGFEAKAAEERARSQGAEAERRAWGLGAEAETQARVMEDLAWAKVQGRIAEAEGKGRVIPLSRIRWQRWAAAAAIVGGVLLTARWFIQPTADRYAAAGDALEARLEDSSSVTLSPASSIEARMGRTRAISLKGEAYFEVKRDEARPFVIDAGDVKVKVLGTAFTVSAYDTADIVEVRVRSGRVQVAAGRDTLTLTAGQHARYRKSRHLLERAPTPPAEVWGWRIIHFDRAPLDEVTRQLERIYKVKVSLKHEGLARCALTAEFDDEPIEAILRVIADTFGLVLTHEGNDYVLDGEGC